MILYDWHLFTEKDVPKKQPTWVYQQGYEWVNQRAVQGVIQDALWDDWQVEQPTLLEADRHFLQLLEEKDTKEECAGRAQDHQDEGGQNPKRRRELSIAFIWQATTDKASVGFLLWYMGCDESSHRHQSESQDEAQGEVDEGGAT